MDKICFQKELVLTGRFDVAVCGGGPSGIMAALAAARNGARVILLERYGFLGGMATAAFVNPVSTFRKNGQQVIRGLPWEFVERLAQEGGALKDYPSGNVPVDAEKYKLIAQRMLLEAGVKLSLHTYIADAACHDGVIRHLIVVNKSGLSAVAGDYVIDCTGDGDVAAACGAPMQPPDKDGQQPCSLGLRLGGVKTGELPNLHPCIPNNRSQMFGVREAFERVKDRERIPQFGGPWFCTVLLDKEGIVNVNITRTAADATDAGEVSAAECRLREEVFQFVYLLKKYIPAFRDCFLLSTAVQTGFRESRRIRGSHTLSEEEYCRAVHFPDSVARGAHPIDIHYSANTRQDVRFLEQAGYIPYRVMTIPGFRNLLTAGRCVSVDRAVFASIRVQATAMALGQAAGTAAALCRRDGRAVGDADIAALRTVLIRQGADI